MVVPLPQVRTLGETVRLDARTKLLNPKWYEGMMASGYEGVREIQKRLTNTMGWSATAGAVRHLGCLPYARLCPAQTPLQHHCILFTQPVAAPRNRCPATLRC